MIRTAFYMPVMSRSCAASHPVSEYLVCARFLYQASLCASGVGTRKTCRGALGEKHRRGLSHHATHHGISTTAWYTPEKSSAGSEWLQDNANWDYASPTGGAHVDGLPPDFKTSKTHLDSR